MIGWVEHLIAEPPMIGWVEHLIAEDTEFIVQRYNGIALRPIENEGVMLTQVSEFKLAKIPGVYTLLILHPHSKCIKLKAANKKLINPLVNCLHNQVA
jgi:hypothetical protein